MRTPVGVESERSAGPDRVVVALSRRPTAHRPTRPGRPGSSPSKRPFKRASTSQAPKLAAPDGHTWMRSRLRSGLPSPFRSITPRAHPTSPASRVRRCSDRFRRWPIPTPTSKRWALDVVHVRVDRWRCRDHDQLRADRFELLGERDQCVPVRPRFGRRIPVRDLQDATGRTRVRRRGQGCGSTGRCRSARARSAGSPGYDSRSSTCETRRGQRCDHRWREVVGHRVAGPEHRRDRRSAARQVATVVAGTVVVVHGERCEGRLRRCRLVAAAIGVGRCRCDRQSFGRHVGADGRDRSWSTDGAATAIADGSNSAISTGGSGSRIRKASKPTTDATRMARPERP